MGWRWRGRAVAAGRAGGYPVAVPSATLRASLRSPPMSEPTLDILGIGNAIVDVQARAEDSFLEAQGLAKGGMQLVGAEAAEALYGRMGPGVESSGGSAANTCAVAAALGARVGFLGK